MRCNLQCLQARVRCDRICSRGGLQPQKKDSHTMQKRLGFEPLSVVSPDDDRMLAELSRLIKLSSEWLDRDFTAREMLAPKAAWIGGLVAFKIYQPAGHFGGRLL